MDKSIFDAYVVEASLCKQDNSRSREHAQGLLEMLIHRTLVNKYPIQCGNVRFGITVGAGWLSIIDRMCEKIDALMTATPGFIVRFSQIKEKFGGLRVYCDVFSVDEEKRGQINPDNGRPILREDHRPAYNQICSFIHAAEDEADVTCETCGKPGTPRNGRHGYIHTACDDHVSK